MNMFDEARSLKCMLEARKMTQRELARSLSVSPSYVANKLRLLNLTADMQTRIITSGVSERHARALLRLELEKERQDLLDRIIREGLSVARTEALADIKGLEGKKIAVQGTDRGGAVTAFRDMTKSAVESLCAAGIAAKASEKHYKNKLYLTVIIDE